MSGLADCCRLLTRIYTSVTGLKGRVCSLEFCIVICLLCFVCFVDFCLALAMPGPICCRPWPQRKIDGQLCVGQEPALLFYRS